MDLFKRMQQYKSRNMMRYPNMGGIPAQNVITSRREKASSCGTSLMDTPTYTRDMGVCWICWGCPFHDPNPSDLHSQWNWDP